MGIFGFGKKKPNKPRTKVEMRGFVGGKEVPLSNADDAEPVKPLSYYKTIEREIKPLEDVMVGLAVAQKEQKRVDDRIEILKALVHAFYDLKSKCVSLGSDYADYFSEMWDRTDYINRFEAELEDLQQRRDDLAAKEALHDVAVEGIEEKVVAVLRESREILQTDIYAKFDPIVQSDIQGILYCLAKDGVIAREKYGRTYKITYRGI